MKMLLQVNVVPKSGRFSVSVKDGRVKVNLRSAPEGNKANLELIKELSKSTGAPVRIVSGLKSHHKAIEIGMDPTEWEKYLLLKKR
jgi:uncharacterized protein (TIGR00251 family)